MMKTVFPTLPISFLLGTSFFYFFLHPFSHMIQAQVVWRWQPRHMVFPHPPNLLSEQCKTSLLKLFVPRGLIAWKTVALGKLFYQTFWYFQAQVNPRNTFPNCILWMDSQILIPLKSALYKLMKGKFDDIFLPFEMIEMWSHFKMKSIF